MLSASDHPYPDWRHSMRRNPLLGAAASLCLMFATTACGGDDGGGTSEADLVDELSEMLQGDGGGLSAEAADCYAEIIVDEVGADALKDVDLSADEPPEELQDEITTAATRASEECDLSGIGG
jgi:hypothetical protein